MKRRFWAGITATSLLLGLVSTLTLGTQRVFAEGEQPPGPDRFTIVTEDYTLYDWWLTSWENDQVACAITIDHDGLPTDDEVYDSCGEDIYEEWFDTKPCEEAETEPQNCFGYYLHLLSSEPAQREVSVELSPPAVWVILDGCVTYQSTFRCDTLPTLVLTGEEPLEGEYITGIGGRINGEPFTCDSTCQVDLGPTDEYGLDVEFWAYSSYGDSSDVFQARVRVIRSDDESDDSWYTDVLSSQWRGDPLAGCSQIWDIFPPVGGVPDWLETPQKPEELATNVAYGYLAGRLIESGMVDVAACDDGGLSVDGFASACGMEVALPMVQDWQNRFDDLIFSAAQETGVSAQLLKKIFARESQFWPGATTEGSEAGLGQMTEGGADTILMWNPSFYEQFCPTVLDESVCKAKIYPSPEEEWEYMGLEDADREILRSVLVQSVDSACEDCLLGVDMEKANYSVGIFAQMLVASCEQAGMVIENNTDNAPAEVATYEDLWRFTLVDYNAGPGCLGLAIDKTINSDEELNWENVSSHLTRACQGALDYVADVSSSTP